MQCDRLDWLGPPNAEVFTSSDGFGLLCGVILSLHLSVSKCSMFCCGVGWLMMK